MALRASFFVELCFLLAIVSGCSSRGSVGGGGRDAGPGRDAGMMDASAPVDAGSDASVTDAGATDGGARDAGATDAAPFDAGPMDAGPADAGLSDAGPPDAGPPDSGPPVGTPASYQCVPAVAGNEMNAGIVLSSGFWSGFRFEVPGGADVTTTSMQVNLKSNDAGTVFGALVRLTDRNDRPDAADLTSSDVLATTTLTVPGGSASTTVSAPVTAVLPPGWYAAIFGTGAFGTSLTRATIHSNSGGGGCGSGYGFPFTIRQSDGMFILQGASPHFQVDGVRP